MLKRALALLILLPTLFTSMAQMPTPDQTITYKQSEQRDLELHIFYPNDQQNGKNRPVVINFFGGGWVGGDPKQFFDQCEYYASLGMVAISVDYRVSSKDKTSPFQSVMDAKSAVRWVRQNKKMLGIDPDKIVTSGGSAGGHIAVCTALIEGVEDDPKLKVSSVPNAMILFNPVVNTTAEGYGANKLVGHETDLSPLHHVRPNLPPTLLFHGTCDTTVPYQNAVDFVAAMTAQGNDCTLISAFGENHGFFNSPNFRASAGDRNYKRAMRESAIFLAKLGYISEDLIPSPEPIRIACAGNSITFGSRVEDRETNCYPAVLQNLLGDDYEVRNFGRSGATLLNRGNIPYSQTQEYKDLVEFAPDIVIVKLGTNDTKAKNWCYGEDFEADYTALIKSFKSLETRRPEVYLCTPMPAFTPIDSPSINSAIVENEILPKVGSVAKDNRLVLIDLHRAFAGCPTLFPDKIHPNAEGAKMMATYIYDQISGNTPVTK